MLFEEAVRCKLRFESDKGLLSVENLWDLSINQLMDVGRKYVTEQKEQLMLDDMDLFDNSKTDEERKREAILKLRLDIIKYIVQTKQAEKLAAEKAAELARKKQKLAELLERKDDELLLDKSAEEIREMLQKMQ